MLKLERTVNSAQLAIQVREREPFFHPLLLQALAYALILHFGALLLFHVTPFSASSSFLYPPVHVQSDTPHLDVAAAIPEEWSKDFIPPPPLPSLPFMDWNSFLSDSLLTPSKTWEPESLRGVEKQIWPEWETPLSMVFQEPRIRLSISGELAEVPLIQGSPLLDELQPISSHPDPAYVSFQVLMNERTGEIFWFERTESSKQQAINQQAEKIVLDLRFTPHPSRHESVQGVLDFAFL